MIRIKNHKQLEMFDSWNFLTSKQRQKLDQGWPGLFREHLLSVLPVDRIKPFFQEDFGRPCKEIYTTLGVLLFQQTMDLNDEEAVEHLMFNIQWHYALNITESSNEAKYISEKTIWTMRQLLTEHNLDQVIMDAVSDKLAKVFKVNTDNQRIDSVHIKSNMRRLGRIGIFSQTIHKFLVNLKRHHRDLFDGISAGLLDRYFSPKALAAFSLVKPSEASKTLQVVSSDLFDLIDQLKDNQAVCAMHSYKLMQRVLQEQCNVQPDENGRKLTVKKPKQIASNSLQNPSDPDATYSSHKGQGYKVQVMETFTQTEDKEEKKQTLNMITHVAVEKACEHDSHSLIPAIEDTRKRELGPKTALADTHYGSDDNVQSAKSKGVDLVAPAVSGGKKTAPSLNNFQFKNNGRVKSCPAGLSPIKVKNKKDRFTASFSLDRCKTCPHVDECPVYPGKKNYYLRYSRKDYRLAVRRAMESNDEFIDTYRWRAGIEATMSQYDRLTGVKRLRVRGFEAVRYCATLKAAGLNILRAAAVKRARMLRQQSAKGCLLTLSKPCSFFKEQIIHYLCGLRRIFSLRPIAAYDYFKLAA